MSRALNLAMTEQEALTKCTADGVGVSAIEQLPAGGVRLVCMSSEGADTLRRSLKKKLIEGEVVRVKIRSAYGVR
ncbi:MAG: hypothetical protein ABR588_10345 [Sphingomicrobium sp.]